MIRVFSFLEYLANAIWIGSIVMFAFAVAGTVFKEAGSITLAGHLNGIILQKLNKIEWIAAIVLMIAISGALLYPEERTLWRFAKLGVVIFMLLSLYYYSGPLTDRLEHLRVVEIADFDHFDTTKQAFRDEFNVLHKRYTTFVSLNMILNIVVAALNIFGKKG